MYLSIHYRAKAVSSIKLSSVSKFGAYTLKILTFITATVLAATQAGHPDTASSAASPLDSRQWGSPFPGPPRVGAGACARGRCHPRPGTTTLRSSKTTPSPHPPPLPGAAARGWVGPTEPQMQGGGQSEGGKQTLSRVNWVGAKGLLRRESRCVKDERSFVFLIKFLPMEEPGLGGGGGGWSEDPSILGEESEQENHEAWFQQVVSPPASSQLAAGADGGLRGGGRGRILHAGHARINGAPLVGKAPGGPGARAPPAPHGGSASPDLLGAPGVHGGDPATAVAAAAAAAAGRGRGRGGRARRAGRGGGSRAIGRGFRCCD